MTSVAILHRGRFRELPGASARRVRANAWTVTVPCTPAIERILGGSLTPERFDGSTWLVGEEESVSALGEGARDGAVTVSVLLP